MRRIATILVLVAAVGLFAAPGALAEGTTCANPTVVIADGRITQSTIANNASYFFTITSRANSSYSAEFHNVLGAAVTPPGTLSVFSDTGCSSSVTTVDTTNVDPADPNGRRVSFTAATTTTRFELVNNTGGTVTYSFSVSETTMFSPTWSTNGTFNSFYSFLNTTGSTINGTLRLFTTAGVAVGSPSSFAIGPNATAAANTVTLGTVRNTTGTARFTHDGPPGAILVEAAVANFTITPTPYFQPVKFLPVRESTH